MANPKRTYPEGVPGKWFVDKGCMFTMGCLDIEPKVFAMVDGLADVYSYVKKQPEGEEQIANAQKALDKCPMKAIGNDREEG